ncbi:MAG: lysophospholipid acyltransferase family protein [Alphaproteobacteria bacterium]|nr:lysophospholipid acyltransferase family protein [Alphaproteobacteria bacterium]MCY4318859.1 lysophospholipid acyltransferase family protein [Alphaproteobacteria bacterium]
MPRRFGRRLLRRPVVQRFAKRLLVGYVRLVAATTCWRVEGREHLEAALREDGSAVVCFWHGRLMLFPVDWPWPERTHVLISAHRDGQIGGAIAEGYGLNTVSGSTERGGASALRRLVRLVRAGDIVAITPDGPRGPRGVPHPGAAALARLTRVRILPVSWSVRRRVLLGSWDRMLLPLPLNRGVYLFGEALSVADGDSLPHLKQALDRLTDKADRLCGHAPLPATSAP